MDEYKVIITFTERVLGTVPKDEEVFTRHVASKMEEMPDEQLADEIETLPDNVEEKGYTGFHQTPEGNPAIYDYVIKGFAKDACGMLRRARGTLSSRVRAYKKQIDGLLFASPRLIELQLPDGEGMGVLERPLRAQTARGERVALAKSDTCPPGTKLEFTLTVIGGDLEEELLREWFDYGKLRGIGQWRNAAWGTFEYEMEKVK